MKNYIVRVYRTYPGDLDSVSGIVEEIESGQKDPFRGFNELQLLLARSIGKGQFEFPELADAEKAPREINAVIA